MQRQATPILQHFAYQHLPKHLQEISKPFHDLAHSMAEKLTGVELRAGLRKLMEAKDCMVRAKLETDRAAETRRE